MANFLPLLRFLGLIALLRLFAVAPAAAVAVAGDGGSIHDVLRAYGLPGGLLPKGVDSFSLDRSSGLLEVRLGRPCYARFDGAVLFDPVVRANLSYGGLRGVEGLTQEELFLWLPVREILVSDPSSGLVLFDIGVARKQLSASLFENPPECRPEIGKLSTSFAGDGGEVLKMRPGDEIAMES